jgi:hypothetical protein
MNKLVEEAPYHPGYEDAVVSPAQKYKGVDPAKMIWKNDELIRQQADRIAELEKQSEPVAWVYQTKNVDGEPYLTNVSLKPLFGLVTRYGYKEIPLYTTPQTKPLSDEEIDAVLESLDVYIDTHAGVKLFARAIEERHGIK